MLEEIETKMQLTMDACIKELSGLRTGRANTGLVDNIYIDIHGNKMLIKQIATISVSDSKTLLVQVWDKDNFKSCEKTLTEANLGLGMRIDGLNMYLTLPALTEERRKELAKMADTVGEHYKVSMRNIRRHKMEEIKKQQKSKELSEDEEKRLEKKIQELTDKYSQKIDDLVAKKRNDILTI